MACLGTFNTDGAKPHKFSLYIHLDKIQLTTKLFFRSTFVVYGFWICKRSSLIGLHATISIFGVKYIRMQWYSKIYYYHNNKSKLFSSR